MFILVCAVLLFCPEKASEGALEGIRIAWENVIASILPFFVFAQGLIYTGVCEKMARFLKPVFKAMGINTKCIVPFVVSLLAGYPSGGKIVCDMYKDNVITKKEAESFLGFCNNGGVVFAVSVIGGKIFHSYITGVIIFVSQVISALIVGSIFSGRNDFEEILPERKKMTNLAALGKSVASCAAVIGNILAAFIVFHALIRVFGLEKAPFLCGVVELTKGIMMAGEKGSAALAALFFSFGSLSVMAQTASFAAEGDIRLKKCFLGKVLTGVISFIITFVVTICTNY